MPVAWENRAMSSWASRSAVLCTRDENSLNTNGVRGATSSHVTEEPVDGGGARLLPAPRVSPGLAVGVPADGEAVPATVPPPSDLKHDPESEELEEGGGDGELRLAHGQGLADL